MISILIAGLLISALWPWTTQRQMSAYGTHWNDLSNFRTSLVKEGFDIGNIMSSPRALAGDEDRSDTLLIIAGIERGYSVKEIDAITDFMDYGGRVLIADDYGFSGPLLSAVIGDVYLNGSRLYSQSYVKNPAFVKVTATLDRTYDLLLNRPTALQGTLPGPVFSKTDNRTWMDTDSNKEKDIDEEYGSFVIGMRFSGNAVLSDPSIFINDMWDHEDNGAFSIALVKSLLPHGGSVIFDESQHVSKIVGKRVQKEVFDVLVLLAYEDWAKVIMVALAIFCVLAFMRYVKLPTEWRHKNTLEDTWLMNYGEPHISPADNIRIKELLEERIRVASKLSHGEYNLRRKEVIEKVLDDKELKVFLTKWMSHSKKDLEWIVKKISQWKPGPEVAQMFMGKEGRR